MNNLVDSQTGRNVTNVFQNEHNSKGFYHKPESIPDFWRTKKDWAICAAQIQHGYHGSSGDAASGWGSNFYPLANYHRIYAPDIVGHGQTDKPRVRYTLQFFTSFFEDFMRASGLERVNLMGHSLGGGIALGYTLKHADKVEKLILVDSAGLSNKMGLLGRLLLPFLTIGARLRHDEVYLSMVQHGSREPGAVFMDRLSEISAPTLILWGSRDGYLPVRLAYQAHRRLGNYQLYVFKRCWHAPQRERPEEFNQRVLQFLGH